jgi:sugar diacid utilization regulator
MGTNRLTGGNVMATKKTPSREVFAAELKKAADATKKVTEHVSQNIEKKAQEVKTAADKKAAPVKKEVADKAASVKKAVEKAAPEKKTETKKPAAKKVEVKTQVNIQFSGKDFDSADLLKTAEKQFKSEHKGAVLKDIKIYVNTDDSRVYYVANGNDSLTGNFEI